MQHDVTDLRSFYNSLSGRVARRIIRDRVIEMWPEMHSRRLVGIGYVTPYLCDYLDKAERVIAVMPPDQGATVWPDPVTRPNLTCLARPDELPLESESVDRILVVHSLEFSGMIPEFFEECRRVLTGNGRLMLVVPNRLGLWSRADWTPMGQGTPYSIGQILRQLTEARLVHERTDHALYLPPTRAPTLLRAATAFERAGRWGLLPAGVHLVEASKQLYAGTPVRVRAKSPARRGFVPSPVAGAARGPIDFPAGSG